MSTESTLNHSVLLLFIGISPVLRVGFNRLAVHMPPSSEGLSSTPSVDNFVSNTHSYPLLIHQSVMQNKDGSFQCAVQLYCEKVSFRLFVRSTDHHSFICKVAYTFYSPKVKPCSKTAFRFFQSGISIVKKI